MKANQTFLAAAAMALISLTAPHADSATLASQYGILDLTANGGINPNTGVAWQAGDQYRLAFVTSGTRDATSNNPADYNAFVTAQAQLNPALAGTTWFAMVTVNLDPTTTQLLSPKLGVQANTGTSDLSGGAGIGGAGVPVYAMNGTTSIARNNADIWDSWSNPFAGNNTQRLPGIFYSPWLDQNGLQLVTPDAVHGRTVASGNANNGGHVNALGNTTDETTINWGSSNANTTGRIWNRFGGATSGQYSFYAISETFTVFAIPEPSAAALLGLGGLFLLGRRKR